RLRTLFSYHVLSRSESYALSLHDALPIWAARDHDRDRRAAVDLLVRRGLGPDHAPLLDVLGVLPRGLVPEPGLGQRGLGVGERLPGDVRDRDRARRRGDDEADRGADLLVTALRRGLLEHRAGLGLGVLARRALDREADVLEGRGRALELRPGHVRHREGAGRVPDLHLVALLGGAARGRGGAGDDPALGLLAVLALDVLGHQ